MKTFKRIGSFLMAVVMITTMLSTGLTSLASISVSKADVTVSITVPETIYLKPGTANFQYYIAGCENGKTPNSAANATGQISFSVSSSQTPSSITLSYDGAKSVTLGTSSTSNSSTLASSITAGAMNSVTSGLLTWTFTYVIGGKTYKSYAGTYVYAPFLGQTGAQGTYIYSASYGDPTLNAYSFVTGIHAVAGGTHISNFTGTENNKNMSPLVEGWSSNNVPRGGDRGSVANLVPNYFSENSNGGISTANTGDGYSNRTSDKSKTMGDINGYGILYIDSSRYSGQNFTAIPNLKGGWMIMTSYRSGHTTNMSNFGSDNGAISIASNVGYPNDIAGNDSDGHGEGYFGYALTGSIPAQETVYTMQQSFDFRMSVSWPFSSSTVTLYLKYGLKVVPVNKGTLRTTINNAISANYQEAEYTASSYDLYIAALADAVTVLGKPDADANAIAAANTALNNTVNALQRAEISITVSHKLPAMDGFTYTYNGTTYTAADGYITITETRGANAGSDVTVGKEIFNGFDFVVSASNPETKVYANATSDVNHTFTYTAQTATINFNYGPEAAYVQDTSVTTMTVTYGQKYSASGAFPAPKMDGWRFLGWYNDSNQVVTADAVCTVPRSTVNLTANWSCWFGGGHGTAENPFLIANTTHFDYVDNDSIYCIFTNGSATAGKYYRQTADLAYTAASVATPITAFSGIYDGDNKSISIGASTTVSDSTYGSMFGAVSGASVKNLKVTVAGSLKAVGTSNTYTGFFGNVTNSAIENIQMTFSGSTVAGTRSGILAGATATDTTVKNCAVVVNGGSVSGNAFIGNKGSGSTYTNTWVLLNTQPQGYSASSANNLMHVRENGTVSLGYANGVYTFTASPASGWTPVFRDADDNIVTNEVSYTPNTTANGEDDYVCFVKSVTFAAGSNGTLTGAGSYSLRQGETVTGLAPKASDGFRFQGWGNTTDGTMSNSSPYTFTMGTKGGTVTATFAVNTYTLKYNANAGSDTVEDIPQDAVLNANQNVTIAEAKTREGYTFQNWNTAADGSGASYNAGQQYSALSTTNGAVITLYAQWKINTYDVTFHTNGGTAVTNLTGVAYNSKIQMPTTTKTGYKDLKWYPNANGAGDTFYLAGSNVTIKGKTDFYAIWTPISYTISFSAPGAVNVPAAQTLKYDDPQWTIPETYVPEKSGYDFMGWNTTAAGNGTMYMPGDLFKETKPLTDGAVITLTAIWKEASYTVTWDLTGGKIDGSTTNPTTTVTFGGKFTTPKGDLTKSAGRFNGWYTEKNGGTVVTDATNVTITGDTTIYARWDPAQYTVAFDANGGTGTMNSIIATCGVSFKLPDNTFTRPGFTFDGWKTSTGIAYGDGASITTNLTDVDRATVTLIAQWSGRSFRIAYNLNGGSGNMMATSVTMDDANGVTLREYKLGTQTINDSEYEFYGWAYTKAEADAMTATYQNKGQFILNENVLAKCDVNWTAANPTVTLYAVWARHTTVTWDLQGGMLNGSKDSIQTEVIYGQNYVKPTGTYSRSRFEFVGWYTLPNGGGTAVDDGTVLKTNNDTTIYAFWTQTSVDLYTNYTAEYYLQNADGTYPTTATYTNTIRALVDAEVTADQRVYAGYTFDASNANNVLSGRVLDNEEGLMLTLKLYYTVNIHTLSFNANTGSGTMAPITVKYGEKITLPASTFTKTGYAFGGWMENADSQAADYNDKGAYTGTDAEATLYAFWTLETYSISIDLAGGTVSTENPTSYNVNSAAITLVNPTKTGYTFAGWTGSNGSKPQTTVTIAKGSTGNKSYTANWETVSYSITVDLKGGSTEAANPTSYTVESNTITLVNPAKTGYTFLGWTGSNGSEPQTTVTIAKGSTGNKSYTANWEAVPYSISVDLKGGSTETANPTSYTVESSAITLVNPTRKGYTFLGWTGSNGSEPQTAVTIAKGSTGNKSYTANWDAITYTIAFNANGGNGTMQPITGVKYDANVALTDNAFSKTGSTFQGWATEADADDYDYRNKASVSNLTDKNGETVTLYAVWTVNSYTIAFNSDGGSAVASITLPYGAAVTAPSNPTKEGYTFVEWTPALPETMPAQNMTLTATWRPNAVTVTFYANGGTGSMDPISVEYGKEVNLPKCAFRKTGYNFAGWARTAEGAATIGDEHAFTGGVTNVDLYAKWNANKYYVEFRGNGATSGTMETMECTYDQNYTLTENRFAKIGATFRGWATSENGEVVYLDAAEIGNLTTSENGRVVLFAAWENIIYTLTFDGNGTTENVPAAMEVIYNQKVNLPAAEGMRIYSDTAKESRNFLGWRTADSTAYTADAVYTCPAENVTFSAEWSANYYALDKLIELVRGYRDADRLPANSNDALYAAGGEMARQLGSNGSYAWANFDTTALESAYAAATGDANRTLPQAQQAKVDALAAALQNALDALTLKNVDLDARYACTHSGEGYYDEYSGKTYPQCEEDAKHSYNSLIAAVDRLVNMDEYENLYTAESVEALREEIYGSATAEGIANEVTNAALKAPAQAMLRSYVDRMAAAYHTILQLKDADYTHLDALITEYLPGLNGVQYDSLESYYTADSAAALREYYDNISRDYKNVNQSLLEVGGDVYTELKDYIDSLIPGEGDYTDVFYQILNIPTGTVGFTYPASNVTRANYNAWITWAKDNAGKISAQMDTAYLNAKYTEASVAALNRVLNGINWNLNIFAQNTINGADNATSYMKLVYNAIEALTPRTYNITYMVNDGTDTVYTIDKGHEYGARIGTLPPSNPTREGYVFKGWSTDAQTLVPVSVEERVYGDLVFYANWGSVYDEVIELVAAEGSPTVIDTERHYIYGLKAQITEAELRETYLAVIGNGRLVIESTGSIGTGTVVKLVSNYTNEVLETYELVIFGDINGDGMINSTDVTELKMMNARMKEAAFNNPFTFAADVYADSNISSSDVTKLRMVVAKMNGIDQVTRELV